MPGLRRHLDIYSAPSPDGFVFVGVKGGQLRRSDFSKPWAQALARAGLPGDLHVHDLRHTGNTLTSEAGASIGELMNRMGHSSTRAASIYLHSREEREEQLAAALDSMARRELKESDARHTGRRSGTQRAHSPESGDSQGGAGNVNRVSELRIRGLERVTGIEPALSVWELDRSCLSALLTRKPGCPGVAMSTRCPPCLIAR
jgi:Phage integrase family